eukprot:TRINITY_DN58630_c0_g1_i1.p1 TRINITY_DN58630_c0_g1~~TRINITY_DN58630_c0_g1_i1.p1  ORF type:complete len:1039 (-),score=87.72 TRINITY_DN58630_c0_g1_i1:1117-3924(-)
MHDELIGMYQRAHAAMPQHLETTENLFYAYLRAGKYNEMAKVCLELSRAAKDSQVYKLWTIASRYMLIPPKGDPACSEDNFDVRMVKGLIQKHLASDKPHQEVFWLYMEILQRIGKPEEAITLCLSADADKCFRVPADALLTLATLYKNTNSHHNQTALCQHMIDTLDCDNWHYYSLYFEGLQQTIASPPTDPNITFDFAAGKITVACTNTASSALQFLQGLAAREPAEGVPKRPRAPRMAVMELCSLILTDTIKSDVEKKDAADTLKKAMLSHVGEYFSGPVCFLDVAKYCDCLVSYYTTTKTETDSSQLLADIQAACTIEVEGADEKKQNIRKFFRDTLGKKLSICTSVGLGEVTPDNALKHCSEFLTSYEETKPLSVGLEPSERHYEDDYVMLFTNLALLAYNQSNDCSWIIRALAVLETAVVESPNNHAFHLIRIRLYAILGCPRPDLMKTLDIKFIQCDTLSYLILPTLFQSGMIDHAMTWLVDSTLFYRSYQRESAEHFQHMFTHGTLSRISETQEFKDRLQYSITALELGVYHMCLMSLNSCKISELRTLFTSPSRYSDMMKLKARTESGKVFNNEDYDPLGILLYAPKGNEKHSALLNALLPRTLTVAQRLVNVRLLLSIMFVLRAILAEMKVPEQEQKQPKAGKQKGKGKGAKAAPGKGVPQHHHDHCCHDPSCGNNMMDELQAAAIAGASEPVVEDKMTLAEAVEGLKKHFSESVYNPANTSTAGTAIPVYESAPMQITINLLLLAAQLQTDPQAIDNAKDTVTNITDATAALQDSIVTVLSSSESDSNKTARQDRNSFLGALLMYHPLWQTFGNMMADTKWRKAPVALAAAEVYQQLSKCIATTGTALKEAQASVGDNGHWATLHKSEIKFSCEALQLPASMEEGVAVVKKQVNEAISGVWKRQQSVMSDLVLEYQKCATLLAK